METISSSQFSELKNIITSLKDEMVSNNNNIMSEFKHLQNSVQFMSNKFDDMAKENGLLKNDMKLLQKQNSQNMEQIKIVEKENTDLRIKLNHLENLTRLTNLEIHNVPEAQNENTSRIAINILKIANPNICDSDIDDSFRIRRPSATDVNAKPTPIIVQFNSAKKRMMVLSNRRNLARKNFQEMGIESTKKYINENLTSFSRQLFYRANILKKANGWKYIWTRDGVIKLRKDDNASILNIHDTPDLEKITK